MASPFLSFAVPACLTAVLLAPLKSAGAEPTLDTFRRDVQPILAKYCYDCHGNGVDKGGVSLDEFNDVSALKDHTLWLRALRNVRSGLMPPAEEEQLPAAEAEKLMGWIKHEAFGLEAEKPDPGRVTVRRLNRVEYRNTIKELTGVDYDTAKEFPADDTGHGFDNIADVLTISPMLLEKYLDAAQTIVAQAVPTQPRVVAEHSVRGREFVTVKVDTTIPEAKPSAAETVAAVVSPAKSTETPAAPPGRGQGRGRGMSDAPPPARRPVPTADGDALDLSYYTPAIVASTYRATHAGQYQVTLDLRTAERYVENQFDLNRCTVKFSIDGEKVLEQEFVREGTKRFEFPFNRDWAAGDHELKVEIVPVAPDRPQLRNLRIRLNAVVVRGPMAEEHWVQPKDYARFFPRSVPADAADRRTYARELLRAFATRAFRRPVETPVVERLVALAEDVSAQPKATFEAGIAQAMAAVLASPSFLFRDERVNGITTAGAKAAPLDDYALASRLSYFFWSSMPDGELFKLAEEGRLRGELSNQVSRMLRDPKSREFVKNFTGQWLQARDIGNVAITALDVFLRDHPNPEYDEARQTLRRLGRSSANRSGADAEAAAKAREVLTAFARLPKPELTADLRRAMQEETELTFAHILKEDRSVLELIESDYTFLNEDLAKHYGIEGVTGRAMRKVALPAGSPRGGVLTQGTVLTVTSNPTRTSPVKRGVFILEAILGTPPAPPPPNIPSLEDAATPAELKAMSLRETLDLHAKDPLCRSCHNRMDPLGLALENFNAMGQWRTSDAGQPVQPAGKLITGETFSDVRELKRVLTTARRRDFYYALSEKMLTYALGRGVEFYDTLTLDQIVAQLEASGGRLSTLISGIVNSAAFQQRRVGPAVERVVGVEKVSRSP